MGMYDLVSCKVPLPDGNKSGVFQTKDFGPMLETYTIDDAGRLLGPDGDDLNFHGTVNFYTLDERNRWYEYNAKFTDGQLVEITKVVETPKAESPQDFS